MKVKFSNAFSGVGSDPKSEVFEVYPDVFADRRGSFAEIFKSGSGCGVEWLGDMSWVRQVNRSKSVGNTVRGCHAQRGPYCQGKLVTAVAEKIYDVITDARPDSGTFGVSSVFLLDPDRQNMLWVPRGFLHAFAVPPTDGMAVFEYWCDNVYDKPSEIGVNPNTILPVLASELGALAAGEGLTGFSGMFERKADLVMSEKDLAAEDYVSFMDRVSAEYEKTGKAWYR